MSVTRLARSVMHTTFPISIHEAKNLPLGLDVVVAPKNIATEPVVYGIAQARSLETRTSPAYSLVSIGYSYVVISDPGLVRIYEIKFTAG